VTEGIVVAMRGGKKGKEGEEWVIGAWEVGKRDGVNRRGKQMNQKMKCRIDW
jgi:hypothetical protein